MGKVKKRPSKAAKAAQKIVKESKLLTAAKTAMESNAGSEFRPASVMPKTADANKSRPDKKRG